VRATEEKKIGEDKGWEEWDPIKLGAKTLNVFVDSTMMALRFSR